MVAMAKGTAVIWDAGDRHVARVRRDVSTVARPSAQAPLWTGR